MMPEEPTEEKVSNRLRRGLVAGALAIVALPLRPAPNLSGYPNSLAALGDSITRAFNTGTLPFTDAPANSWSTGTARR